MNFDPLNKIAQPPTSSSYVVEYIREGILSGLFPLGSRLDQKAIAKEVGVSLVPVREALRLLEGDGYIHIYPHRGAYVTDISLDELEELYMVRELLEGKATRLAVAELTEDQLEELSQIVLGMEEATAERDYARLLELNAAFHFTLYEASGKTLLVEIIASLWNRSTLYRSFFTYLPERAPQALAEHRAIHEACSLKDEAMAEAMVRKNISQTVLALSAQFTTRAK